MEWQAHNAGFVWAAYAISALAIIALTIWCIRRDKRLAREIKNRKDPA